MGGGTGSERRRIREHLGTRRGKESERNSEGHVDGLKD